MNKPKNVIITAIILAMAIIGPIQLSAAPSSHAPISPNTFYIDPSYTGSEHDGSADAPWVTLDRPVWAIINKSLDHEDVTIYCSARQAASDADETYGSPSEIDLTSRSERSTTTLTFDGHNFYNTNDQNPAWLEYRGASMCRVRDFNATGPGHHKNSDITIDGFRIGMDTSGKALNICGDNWTIRNSDIFHTAGATDGPLIQLVPTADLGHEGSEDFCSPSSNILIENNKIHDSAGELIYLGGGGCTSADPTAEVRCDGFPAHTGIIIRNNILYNGGIFGGQGDGIDAKGGLSNVIIDGNVISNLTDPGDLGVRAIVFQGVRPSDPDQNIFISNNNIHDINANASSSDAAISLANSWGTPKGVAIWNNTIARSSQEGIRIYGGTDISVWNNRICDSGSYGIDVAGDAVVTHNILSRNGTGGSHILFGTTSSAVSNKETQKNQICRLR
jgi:hypothetical protein